MKKTVSLLMALYFVGLSGCAMWSPYDGQTVPSTTATVTFQGSTANTGELVGIGAVDFQDPNRPSALVASVTTSASAPCGVATCYPWSTTAVLPSRFWLHGFPNGFGAKIKASGYTPLITVESNFFSCWVANNQDQVSFMLNCRSDHYPYAWIGTSGFVAPSLNSLDIRRYVTAPALTTTEIDTILNQATIVLQEIDVSGDVRCGVEFQRKPNTPPTFSIGDGSVDSQAEFDQLGTQAGDGFIVNDLNWCETIRPNLLGCCCTGPQGAFVAVRNSNDAITWAHEYGHHYGLDHRDNDSHALMNSIINSSHREVLASECSMYGGSS